MKYKAVLFDMDGTILDTIEDLCRSLNYALALFSLPAVTNAQTAAWLGNGAKRLVEQAVGEAAGEEKCAQVLAEYRSYYQAHSGLYTRPYEGIPELLEQLRREGLLLAVISNKPDETVHTLVQQYFPAKFDFVLGERADIPRKPAPDPLWRAAEALGCSADECVYLGDSEVDVRTAAAAGMDCISVVWGFRTREELLEAGASALAETPAEIRTYLE